MARKRNAFPDPIKVLSRTMLWLWPDVEPWAVREGWVRWPAQVGEGDRVMILPADIVPGSVIQARLGLAANDAGEIEELTAVRADPVEGALYLWGDAEELWHEQANRSRQQKLGSDPPTRGL